MTPTAEPRLSGFHVNPQRHRSQVSWSWADRDSAPSLTLITVAAALAAVAMAIFGLPPVNLHGPWHYLGVMDPLCGMTRASRLLALGHIRRAVAYNPASPLLGFFGAIMLARTGVGWVRGRWLRIEVHLSSAALIVLGALIALLWANQQAHATLLMRS
jgi:Protein of unknown function (DUF2752)